MPCLIGELYFARGNLWTNLQERSRMSRFQKAIKRYMLAPTKKHPEINTTEVRIFWLKGAFKCHFLKSVMLQTALST